MVHLVIAAISLLISVASLICVIRTTRKTERTWKRVAELQAEAAEAGRRSPPS